MTPRVKTKSGVRGSGSRFCMAILSAALLAGCARTGPAATTRDGKLVLPTTEVPFSTYASPQARQVFVREIQHARSPSLLGGIGGLRAFYDAWNRQRLKEMEAVYPVVIRSTVMNGVPVQIVTPAKGVSLPNRNRVLVDLHGGAFLWGAGAGGLIESVPIAAIGGYEVITVDYRQAPEHRFPAASEDVEAVYRELLKAYPAANIGIYGASAGAVITDEALARFEKDGLPMPGAIGNLCGSGDDFAGDSSYVAPLLDGAKPSKPLTLSAIPYFNGASLKDPLVAPMGSPPTLRHFPPTLLLAGTRDFSMSSVVHAQEVLTQVGVEADLHLWDGMWHGFFAFPKIPESRQVYDVVIKFFDDHLANSKRTILYHVRSV